MSRARALRPLQTLAAARGFAPEGAAVSGTQLRTLFGKGVPEYWGRDSPYHPGTEFLGTPANHLELAAKRPLSPDVVDIDLRHPHYKFPLGAISSITNRVTGVMLSVGTGAVGYLALAGDVGGLISTLHAHPLLLFPAKAAVTFPLAYHYLGGLRHIYWDHCKFGNMADKAHSSLELPSVEASSKLLLGASAAATVLLAAYSA